MAEFKLDCTFENGKRVREHYMLIAQRGIEVKELENECPKYLFYLWQYFCDIVSYPYGRSLNADLGFDEIWKWQQLRGIILDEWEYNALRIAYQLYQRMKTQNG
jgi:hypothetical protein